MDKDEKIKELEEKNANLETELQSTKEHLKKYTAPASRKMYYENNKEVINERNRTYKENTNYKPTSEQKKEYNRQAYLIRKEKLKMEATQNNENI
jgi:hypothetical protein